MNRETISCICKALGDPNRLKIVESLADGEKCACRLLEELNITQPTLSQMYSFSSELLDTQTHSPRRALVQSPALSSLVTPAGRWARHRCPSCSAMSPAWYVTLELHESQMFAAHTPETEIVAAQSNATDGKAESLIFSSYARKKAPGTFPRVK